MTDIIDAICKAWQSKNVALLEDVLADSFIWFEAPFQDPVTDKNALLKMWQKDLMAQENIKIKSEVLSDDGAHITAHWIASFTRLNHTEAMDGVFFVTYNEAGKLTEFRQWWVSK